MKKYIFFELILIFLIFFGIMFPDVLNISPRHSITWQGMYVPQWDSNNAVVWAYMINKGLVPFKDFWYPYSFSYLFDYLQPWGVILQFFITGYLVLSLYYLLRVVVGNIMLIPFLAILLLIAGFLPINNIIIFPQPERHLFPFVIALYYLVCSNLFYLKKPIYLFWISICLCLIFEPSQIIYTAPALVILTLIEFKYNNNLKIFIIEIFSRFLPLCIVLLTLAYYFFKNNMLNNVMDMYLHMDSISNYLAVPTDIGVRTNNIFELRSFFFIMPYMLFGLGYFSLLFLKNEEKIINIAILVVASIGIMQLYKHSIRQTEWTIFYSSYIGLVLFSTLIYKKVRLSHLYIGGFIGGISGLLLINGLYFSVKEKFYNVSNRANSLLEVLKYDDLKKSKYRDDIFNSNKTKAFEIDYKVIDKIEISADQNPNFYSLTDNQILYLLTNKIPPYHINGLNESPIFEQNKIINYLTANKTEFIIIDKSKLFFDGFSYIVRLPKLFNYVVKNYYIKEYVGDIAILKIKSSSLDGNYNSSDWDNLLGTKINYGYLIASSKLTFLEDNNCKYNCNSYIVIKTKQFATNTQISIGINKYKIEFMAIPNKNTYVLDLNNIWFWSLIKNPHIKFDDNVVSYSIINSNSSDSKNVK